MVARNSGRVPTGARCDRLSFGSRLDPGDGAGTLFGMGKRRYVMIRKRERPTRREGPSTNKDGLTAQELIRQQDERIRNMTPAELAASLDGLGKRHALTPTTTPLPLPGVARSATG